MDYSSMAGYVPGLVAETEEDKKMGILDRIAGGINKAYSDPARARGLTQMGLALMDAAGPRPLGQQLNTGQILARGFAGYQQGKDAFQQQQLDQLKLAIKAREASGAGEVYKNVQIDDLGQAWGLNTISGQFEQIPMSGPVSKYKTSTYVDPQTGGVSTVLINPRDVIGGGEQRQPDQTGGPDGIYRLGGDKTSEKQERSASFATRMENASQELEALRESGYVSPGITDKFADMLPAALQGYVQSPEYRRYRTAADDWIMSTLRDESGAAISAEETGSYFNMYFPQPGESRAVIAQKERARQTAEENMRSQAGSALERRGGQPPATSGKVSTPQQAQAAGWKLMTDANGNRAYVGPQNQIVEVK